MSEAEAKPAEDDRFILEFLDDSMEPTHLKGWRGIFKSCNSTTGFIPNGSVIAIKVGGNLLIRRMTMLDQERWELTPFNPKYTRLRCYPGATELLGILTGVVRTY